MPQAAGLFPPGGRGCWRLLQGKPSCGEAGRQLVQAAPDSQRLGFCCHQSSRGRASQTRMLVSGTGGRDGLSQAQSTLDGRLKPQECIPCRPIGTPWLPVETADYRGPLWKQLFAARTKCREPVGSWLGQKQRCPRSSLTNPCKRRDWRMTCI